MELSQQHKEQLDELVGTLTCRRNFKCYNQQFEWLPRTEVIGGGRLVECFEEGADVCPFLLPFGDGAFCKCPVRNFVAKNLHL